MKTYGSAVLTALQAQYMSVKDIGHLVTKRKLKAFMSGGIPEEWLECFWKEIEILRSNRIGREHS